MMRICKWCGKEFDAYRRQIYCSAGCKIKANNSKKPASGKMKECKICGKEFFSRHGAKFCSELCKAKEYQRRAREKWIPKELRKDHKVYPPKKCIVCGEEFIPGSGSAKYCSAECHAKGKCQRADKGDTPRAGEGLSCKGSEAVQRYRNMNLREVAAECARLHLTYGQAQMMADNGTLPEEFGKGCRK